MLTFATLFLGLALGPQEVSLVVEGDVGAVVVRLDDREVGTLSAPPWDLEVDLGPDLHPHKLEAVALGADGEVLERAVQWINLPRDRAEAAWVLEGEPGGRPTSARLVWSHVEQADAESVEARFNGRPVGVSGDGRVRLPSYDPEEIQVLEADLRFEDGARYRAELGFGARLGYGADADLTGVSVVSRRRSLPDLTEMADWFLVYGQTARVLGAEKSPARLVFVVDRTALPSLHELAAFGSALTTSGTALRRGERVRFVFPDVRLPDENGADTRLFSISQEFTPDDGSISWLLTRIAAPPSSGPRRVTDAVAVAGVQAAAESRPRAVVLVLGYEADDVSAYSVPEVRRFLRELRVPLYVWWTGRPTTVNVSEDRRSLTVSTAWGKADDISSLPRLTNQVEELRSRLEAQHTVWVEGRHLPSTIELSPRAKRIALAGSGN